MKHVHHPLAEIFPPLAPAELAALASDIKEHGLREPITTYKGAILDGRNRMKACGVAGVEARFEEYEGNDPVALVVSRNMFRRHLTTEQRALSAAKLATLKDGVRSDRQGASVEAPTQQRRCVRHRRLQARRRQSHNCSSNEQGPLGLYRKTCDDPPTFELIPAWLARYWPDTWAFRVACLNPPAFKLFRTERQVVELTESEYVSRLWEARGFDPAIQTLKIQTTLGTTLPPAP